MQLMQLRWSKVGTFFTLTLVLVLSLIVHSSAWAYVAEEGGDPSPGEELLTASGTLTPGQSTLPYQVFTTGIVNFELTVTGGDPTDAIQLTVDDGAAEMWSARSGEEHWGTLELDTTANSWVLTNTSDDTLSFTLRVFEIGEVPVVYTDQTTWGGQAVGGANPSIISLVFPSAGLYEFAFDESQGRYQFALDERYFRHTVEAGESVSAYVNAGVHTLTIYQDPAVPTTTWGVSVTELDATDDTLPYTQMDGMLGGAQAFDEAWFPLAAASAQEVNVEVTVDGNAADEVTMELYNSIGGNNPQTTLTALGGETVWIPSEVVNGVNRLHLVANSGAPVSITVTVHAVPETPYGWMGMSNDVGTNSQILLDVPTSGIYQFDFGVEDGRYQFMLDDEYLQVTVEEDNIIEAWVEEGRHLLTLDQDSGAGAEWSASISLVTADTDVLPYHQSGGDLSGAGNDFDEEWWPLVLDQPAQVNVRLVVTGTVDDALALEVYDAAELVQTRPAVYGSEEVWLTLDLSEGVNRLHLVGAGANSESLQYHIDVYALPAVPTGWSGVALDQGDNSFVRFVAPIDGTYDIQFTYSEGALIPRVDPPTQTLQFSPRASRMLTGTIMIRVPLEEGVHTLELVHDRGLPRTVWTGEVTLRAPAEPLALTSSSPDVAGVDEDVTVTVLGSGFEAGAEVYFLTEDDIAIPAKSVQVIDPNELDAVVPASLGAGTYDIQVVNPASGESAVLTDALTLLVAFTVTDVSPNVVGTDDPGTLTITGSGFTDDITATLEDADGNDIAIPLTFVSSTELEATLPDSMPAGTYDLILERDTPAQTETVANALRVVRPFTVTDVSPTVVGTNAPGTLTVTGTGFTADVTARLVDEDGNDVAVTVSLVSSTELAITLPNPLPAGTYDLIIERDAPAQSETVEDAVVAVAPFSVDSISPDQIRGGTSATLTIDGSNFTDDISVLLRGPDNNTIELEVTSVTPTEIQATIPNDLIGGSYDVILQRDDPAQSETVADALMVVQGSTLYLPIVTNAGE